MVMATVVDEVLRSVNPATLEVVGSVPLTAPGDVASAVDAAGIAQEAWARESFAERRALLVRVMRLVLGQGGSGRRWARRARDARWASVAGVGHCETA